MRLIPSDPNIKTIIDKIKENDINLQPDFQRGEVWNIKKQKRLIDSILRDWHVPPIHVVEVAETRVEEVLDGQQRLVAIRDFVHGKFSIDGMIEPINEAIVNLHGSKYDQLSDTWRRQFDKFTIRFFTIVDYQPEEPWELFYRLNETTKLTSAEQRNAFYGPARQQVKELVEQFNDNKIIQDIIGFDNSRMAYDDIVAKLCYTLEINSLQNNISGANITSKYRSREPFNKDVYDRANYTMFIFGESTKYFEEYIKFNKATLYSWLCFIAKLSRIDGANYKPKELGEFINYFEYIRSREQKRKFDGSSQSEIILSTSDRILLKLFNDKASSRVANTLSVINRDLIIWIFYIKFREKNKLFSIDISYFESLVNEIYNFDDLIDEEEVYNHLNYIIDVYDWGSSI